MTTSAFKITTAYTPRDRDFLVIPFCDAKHLCTPKKGLPKPVAKVLKAPVEPGGTSTVFAGRVKKASVLARARRLDAKHSSPKEEAKRMVAESLCQARKERARRVVVFLSSRHQDLVRAVQEGALLGGYAFQKYLKKKVKPLPVLLVCSAQPSAPLKKKLKSDAAIGACTNFARDVLNGPPNVIRPPRLAQAFQKQGKASGLKIAVWDEKRLKREGCGGILGVGRGSSAAARLVIGEHRPKRAKKHLCLVGKGVTFDSGGYCLKPSASQVGMKYDMGGAAMMFAAACAIARLRLPLRVTVLTPLVENTVDGDAYLTTSILTMRNKTTVEVHNTDAEGRLILADALALAAEKKPDWIVDAATLTGACVVALGNDIAGLYGTDRALTEEVCQAGRTTGEDFWPLPLHMPYAEQLKTTIADCKNMGGKYGGSITAALFLKQFVPESIPWVHLDIAGPGIKEEPLGHLGKGAKGFGVKTVTELARQLTGQAR